MNGVNAEFFFSLYLYALKFDMAIIDACVDGMGGFRDSNTTHTNNSIIKRKNSLEQQCFKCDQPLHILYQ
jgi:hypothetical protein